MKYFISEFNYWYGRCSFTAEISFISANGITEINMKHEGLFDVARLEKCVKAQAPLSLKKLNKILHNID